MLNELCFTPAEFARLAKIPKDQVKDLETDGKLEIVRRRMGNVDRKMITMPAAQRYFQMIREFEEMNGRHGDQTPGEMGSGAESAGPPVPMEAMPPGLILPRRPKSKVQMFYNIKGGTGKSTLTAQYVMLATMMGYRVLAVDLDGQGHLSVNLDILNSHERPSIYDVLINDLPIQETLIEIAPGLHLLPANLGLCNIEIPLNLKPRREYRLGEALDEIKDQYDLIVADTNPAASLLNSSMLVASNLINVICATNPLAFHGMSLVLSTIAEMSKEFRREVEVRIIPNMYDNREVISQEVLGELYASFKDVSAKSVINRCADINEATKRRTTVWAVNSRSNGAQDLLGLTEELLKA